MKQFEPLFYKNNLQAILCQQNLHIGSSEKQSKFQRPSSLIMTRIRFLKFQHLEECLEVYSFVIAFVLFRFKNVLVVSLIRTCMLCSIWLKTTIFHEVNLLFRNIIQNIYFCFGNLFNLQRHTRL